MIFDTNALSAFFDGDSDLLTFLETGTATKISLPVIVLGEYRSGLLDSRLRKSIEPLLDRLQHASAVLLIDTETVPAYAKIMVQLKKAGTPIPTNDVWIAALALQHGLRIVSRDQHFDKVDGIIRVAW